MDPERAKEVLDYAVREKGLIMETGNGYTLFEFGVHRDPRNWRQQPFRPCWKDIFAT